MRLLRTILATLHKEWLILTRDPAAWLILLVMPALLIIIMALIQDAPFRDYQSMRFDLLMVDEDHSGFSKELRAGIQKNPSFRIYDQVEGKVLDASSLQSELKKGRYQLGIVIPKGCGAELANASNKIANELARSLGLGLLPARASRNSLTIQLYFDPVSRPAFRMAIHTMIERQIAGASSGMLLNRMSKLSGSNSDTLQSQLHQFGNLIGVKEYALGESKTISRINSVQHNVPAWAIFGMFFIVVPVAGQIIREREQGSMLRARLIPGAEKGIGLGRILFFAMICCQQFLAMCAVGRWILPLMDLPALTFGAHPWALSPVILATALCATAYGYCLGMCFHSGIQALTFGSISIVILSALGGIWVPVEILPKALQTVAYISPLHWSLSGMQSILLRDQSLNSIWLPCLLLCALAAAFWAIGLLFRSREIKL